MNQLNQIRNVLNGNNPDDIFNALMNNNPKFRSFVEGNKGKSLEQIAKENNIDLNMIKSMM